MCDQDHFEDDAKEYAARGLVTRREFGVLLGAGMRCCCRRSRTPSLSPNRRSTSPPLTAPPTATSSIRRAAPLQACSSGRTPSASARQTGRWGSASPNQAIRCSWSIRSIGLESPDGSRRCRRRHSGHHAAAQGAERDDAHDRCEGVHRVARQAAVGGEEPEGRHTRLLHGRSDCVSHRRRRTRSRGRRRVVPRRRTRDRSPNSPHLQAAKTKAQFLVAIAENDDAKAPNEKNVLKETFAKANLPAEIEVYPAAHGWCPPDTKSLQRGAGREGVEPSARVVWKGSSLRRSEDANRPTGRPSNRIARDVCHGSFRHIRHNEQHEDHPSRRHRARPVVGRARDQCVP